MFNTKANNNADFRFGTRQNGMRGDKGCQTPFGRFFGAQRGDGACGGGRGRWMQELQNRFGINSTPANIQETDESFTLYLYAAGLNKDAFKLSLEENILTIQYMVPENKENDEYLYREYEPKSFERSFQLNGKVLTDQISACYVDGVLTVNLPKNPDTNRPAQEVPVS